MTCELVVPPSGPDPVAIIALIVSGFVFGWQILSYLLQGQRVTVEVFTARTVQIGDQTIGNPNEGVIAVTIRARGRVAVQVDSWAVVFPGSKKGEVRALPEASLRVQFPSHHAFKITPEATPFTVDAGHSKTFYIPREPVEAAQQLPGYDLHEGRIEVYFGARRKFRDSKSIAERLGIE